MTKLPRLFAGGLLFALAYMASDWVLCRCVWSLHASRFTTDQDGFGTFWLPLRGSNTLALTEERRHVKRDVSE